MLHFQLFYSRTKRLPGLSNAPIRLKLLSCWAIPKSHCIRPGVSYTGVLTTTSPSLTFDGTPPPMPTINQNLMDGKVLGHASSNSRCWIIVNFSLRKACYCNIMAINGLESIVVVIIRGRYEIRVLFVNMSVTAISSSVNAQNHPTE